MKIKIGNKVFEVSKKELEGNPEEITLEFDGILRTKDEETTFVENHKKDARKEGIEIAVKKHREEFGFEGRSLDKLIDAVKTKTLEEAKIEPTEQLKKVNQTLQEKEAALNNALNKVGQIETDFNSYKNQTVLNRKLESFIPDNTILPKEDMKLILKTKLNFDIDENGNMIALDNAGNVIKDKTTANPIEAKEVVSGFFKDNQNYLKAVTGGNGGSDSGNSSGKKSIDDFIEEQKEAGNSPNSPGFNEALKTQMAAGLVDVD